MQNGEGGGDGDGDSDDEVIVSSEWDDLEVNEEFDKPDNGAKERASYNEDITPDFHSTNLLHFNR